MTFDRLLHPRSIAVFGGGEACELIRQCNRLQYAGDIWPVHPSKTEIQGLKAYPSVFDLPHSPDAAFVAVNRHVTVNIVQDLAARDAGGAICYATGFTESGQEGSELEQKLLVASGEMPLIGPNCYGLLNYVDGAALWPDQQGGRRVDRGVAIITMSSNVAFNLTMQRRGLPIAYMLSLGNKLKFDLHDAIRILAQQEQVTAIGLYLEGISDPRAFADAVNVARELGKPIVAIKTGRSEIAQEVVISHTASLAGSDKLMSALFERAGVARVNSMEELIEALKVLHVLGPLNGGRVCAMSTSGGDLTLLGDAIDGTNLHMPQLSERAVQRVKKTVHKRMVVKNPLDYQMFNWNDEQRLGDTFTALISDGFDISLCLLDYPRKDICEQSDWGGAERGFVHAVHQTDAKSAVLATFSDTMCETVAERLMNAGIVPLAGIDTGLAGIQAAVEIGAAWNRSPVPNLMKLTHPNSEAHAQTLDEAASKSILEENGVPIPRSKIVCSPSEGAAAAEELGFPVVVKALGITHKTDVGGVTLNLSSREAVAAAITGMCDLSEQFLIEEMVGGCIAELIVGIARDEQFGPYVNVGSGGTLVDLMDDSVSLLLPVSKEFVLNALNQLKCAPLFHGFRGAANADLNAAVNTITAIAAFAEKHAASISELDINPLMLLAEGRGVVAADALLVWRNRHE